MCETFSTSSSGKDFDRDWREIVERLGGVGAPEAGARETKALVRAHALANAADLLRVTLADFLGDEGLRSKTPIHDRSARQLLHLLKNAHRSCNPHVRERLNGSRLLRAIRSLEHRHLLCLCQGSRQEISHGAADKKPLGTLQILQAQSRSPDLSTRQQMLAQHPRQQPASQRRRHQDGAEVGRRW